VNPPAIVCSKVDLPKEPALSDAPTIAMLRGESIGSNHAAGSTTLLFALYRKDGLIVRNNPS
jgi:hypothetical protein